jgi:L-ribulose-5-phosphate 3-epimerase
MFFQASKQYTNYQIKFLIDIIKQTGITMGSLFQQRRHLLKSAAAIASTTILPTSLLAAEKAPLFKISLAQWSLHRTLRSNKIDNLDFAKVSHEEFGIDAIEYVNQFFKDKAKDKKYIAELRKRAEDHGVKSLLIMVDGEGQLGAADPAKRLQTVENHKKWVEAAHQLGCHSIRVNAASSGSYEDQIEFAADGLMQLTQFAETFQMRVIVENHGGYSSDGRWLSTVMQRVNHPHCGTLPDFGNFHISNNAWYDRYTGVEELMPFAHAVSAKSHNFDEAGNETRTDYIKMMKIVLDAGYRGRVGIEYEGGNLDEYAGIKATKKLLEEVKAELAKDYA